jgi:RNA ligase
MLDTLEGYHYDGLLLKQTHPTLDLTIWNYSPKVQYEGLWDDITMQCRGLVTNSNGDVVARPFKKFFNYEEHKPEDLPNEYFEVYEKMDGSLGILFYYEKELTDEERYNIWFNNNYETGMERFFIPEELPDFDNEYYEPTPKTKGEWVLATRGSFTSPQSIKGRELLEKYDYNKLHKDYTYLFEIIYPENRIVCVYDFEDLILLGMIHTKTGNEVNIHNINNEDTRLSNMLSNLGIKIVTLYKTWGEGYDILKQEISKDREGYVIRFRNGFRMKIKGVEYVRLHRIITNISNRDIWEYLKEGKSFDEMLDKVPDEFYEWVRHTKNDLTTQYETLEREYQWIFNKIRNVYFETHQKEFNRREFAELTQRYKHSGLLFNMLDGKDYSQQIWKLIYPSYSKPFKKDEI